GKTRSNTQLAAYRGDSVLWNGSWRGRILRQGDVIHAVEAEWEPQSTSGSAVCIFQVVTRTPGRTAAPISARRAESAALNSCRLLAFCETSKSPNTARFCAGEPSVRPQSFAN